MKTIVRLHVIFFTELNTIEYNFLSLVIFSIQILFLYLNDILQSYAITHYIFIKRTSLSELHERM